MEPHKGAIAIDANGIAGVITSDRETVVRYGDGSSGVAWPGYKLGFPSQSWHSTKPCVVGSFVALRKRLDTLLAEWKERADAHWAEPDAENAYRDCIDDLHVITQLHLHGIT